MSLILAPAVVIADPSKPLPFGECNMAGCTAAARYAIGNYYLCADCLIEACELDRIPVGTLVYRVGERVHFF